MQAIKSYFNPTNPEGCFDWWGYTNDNYSNKDVSFSYIALRRMPRPARAS